MSTTIHYSYEYFGEKANLVGLLNALRREFQEVAVIRVGEVIDMPQLVLQEGQSDLARLSYSLIHSMRMHHNVHEFSLESRTAIEQMILAECNGIGLAVDVADGCDQFQIILGRLGNNAVGHGANLSSTAIMMNARMCANGVRRC